MKNKRITIILLVTVILSCQKVPLPPEPVVPIPTENQLKWHEMERNAFIHFGLNTFNDMEWGYGDTPATTFNPSQLDAEQWVKTIKAAGLKGVVLTAKHHDGFCLWPSKYTDYSVKNSPWRDGKGDLVKEVSDACKKHGLKFGIYLSPWDRNSPIYGTPEYITYFRNQLTELLTNYGDVFEVWFDGANGGTGYYGGANEKRSVDRKTYYDWEATNALVKKLQPNALIFSDGGPDIRWCGNEHGEAGKTNWATLRRDEVWPGWPHYKELNPGHEDGNYWVPAEINVSIRPGWFYHKSEDHKVRDLAWLMDYYYQSVGRNGTGLLNFPVDEKGLIHKIDSTYVVTWQKTIEQDLEHNLLPGAKITASNTRGNHKTYGANNVNDGDKTTYWATDDEVTSASLTIVFDKPITFNRFLVQEDISLGQRVQEFSLEVVDENGNWKEIASETTIGYKRILRLPLVRTRKIKFTIVKSKASPVISNIELFKSPKLITEPIVRRDQESFVTITTADGLDIFYTTDGRVPTTKSKNYQDPFKLVDKAIVKAVAIDTAAKKQSTVAEVTFDISKEKWNVVNSDNAKIKYIFDGNPNTVWHQVAEALPASLVIDLGEVEVIKGFKYLPDQRRWAKGIIFDYEFYASLDGKNWTLASLGEFSNIKNSPVWQVKEFEAVKARYVKLLAKNNTNDDDIFGYAEFDLITR